MIPDFPPENDAIANRARRALHQLAGARPMDASWADVQRSARGVQQKRLSVVGAASALVLIGASAAAANVGARDGRPMTVMGSESGLPSTSDATTTTTSVPFWYGSTSVPTSPVAPPSMGEDPISGGDTLPTTPDESETTLPAPLQPQDGSWNASMSVDASQVAVGDYATVRVELRNTGTQRQQTNGYGSLAITCTNWQVNGESEPGWPVGQFVDDVVMAPGESRSFSMTFWANEQQVGDANCSVGVAFHGDAPWATPFDGLETDAVGIQIVAPSTSSTGATTTTETVPTTETTSP